MQRKKAIKLAGFVGALAASATLVSISVSSTGAYFTDSHDGSMNAGTGQIKVTVSPNSGQLNFDDLLPGEYRTQTISYTAHPRGGTEDVWLVFPNFGQPGDAFTSEPQAGPTPLGRYGHFALSSTAGAHFTSYNLALSPNGGTNASDACAIDANGSGGSNAQSATAADAPPPYCAPANAILLQSDMANTDSGSVDLTFGFTPLLTAPQNMARTPLEPFKIVATQHGVRPDNPNNG